MEKFLGAPYPIQTNAKGYLHTISGVDTIRSDLLILLLTNPGERVMIPEYGTDLRQLMFEPNDPLLESRAQSIIADAIRNWEPRITVENIEVTSAVDDSYLDQADDKSEKAMILGIRIVFFDPQDIQDVQELVLEVPLQGSN